MPSSVKYSKNFTNLKGRTGPKFIKTKSHPIAVTGICKEARDRLTDIKRDDVDELMSFRLTGPNRVWCIQAGNIMRALWWDPEHKICPAKKK